MSNLKIAFPGIFNDALTITPSSTVDTDRNEFNLPRGRRDHRFRFSATSTNETIKCDLGSGNTQSADFCILTRADLIDNVSQILVRRSTDDVSYTTEHTQSTFVAGTDLLGRNDDDLLMTFTQTSAYRYWLIDYTASSASDFEHSKLYLGNLFDPGKDPASINVLSRVTQIQDFIADDGTRYQGRVRNLEYEIRVLWEGLTDANADSLYDNLTDRHKRFCYLYQDSATNQLAGEKFIHCMTDKGSISRQQVYLDWNTVGCTFLEMTG